MSDLKIGIQGIEASFHEMAAIKHFGTGITPIECLTFQQLCEALNKETCDFAVMAIENSIAGSILQNYALLMKYNFTVIGEVYLNIQMNLMALPGVSLSNIDTVQSHPMALRQCSEFLWTMPDKKWVEMEDTALAAKQITEKQLNSTAAIANTLAAERFGLNILKSRIETHKQNFTRFLILSKLPLPIENANKASICIQLKHENGSLGRVLNVFTQNNVNLTKIQSVPIIGKPYEYSFHIDFEWRNESDYEQSMNEIDEHIILKTILGKYKKGNFNLLTQ